MTKNNKQMFVRVLTKRKNDVKIKNEQMFDHCARLKERCLMPELNLLLWLMLLVLAVVAGCLLAAAKNADAADCEALRRLAAASDGKSAPRHLLPDNRRIADRQQAGRPYQDRTPRRPAAVFFSVGPHACPSGERQQRPQDAIRYELPRPADCDTKKAAVSDCPYCA